MNQYRLQAITGTYKPRSQVGSTMGSIDSIQSLIRRLIDSVQSSNERMDSVQAGGMLRRVPLEAIANHMRQRSLRDNAPVDVRGKNDPFPPPPYRSDTGATHNFSPLF